MSEMMIVLVPVIFLGGIVSVLSGGGLSLIITIIGGLFIDIKSTIVFGAYILFINQFMKAIHFGKHARKDFVIWSLVLGIPATYIGGVLLFVISYRAVEIWVGILALTFIAIRKCNLLPDIKPTKSNLLLIGLTSGLIGSLVGNGSLIRKPIFLHMGLTKEVFLGTTALISLVLVIPRIIAYIPRAQWSPDHTIVVLICIPVLFCATLTGKKLLRYVEPKTFELLFHVVIGVGAVKLLIG